MTELKIDLSNFTDRFADISKEFLISKKINFVFGKNGTGKTTIADEIKKQCDDKKDDIGEIIQKGQYDVCIFKDFDGIVGKNKRLDAIALGTENAATQIKIDVVDNEITEIRKEIDEPSDKSENLFTKHKFAENKYDEQDKKISKFYTDSARQVGNNARNYQAKNFQNEITNAKLLSDDEINNHKETIKSEKKKTVDAISFPNPDLSAFLKSTNEILQASVSQQKIIAELQDSADKQNFAKEGLRIHKHETGEKCAFCGNEISEERWQLLGNYFNDEVKKLEDRIRQSVEKIDGELTIISNVKEISKTDFYEKFAEQIKLLNSQIKNIKNEYKTFLESLKSTLDSKTKNLFAKSDELALALPTNFDEIKKNFDGIIKENNEFSQNLSTEQEKAKNALRYHEIKKALENFKYEAEKQSLADLKVAKDTAQKELNDKKGKLEQKIQAKDDLILQTKDENKIAEQINQLLKNMGFASFSLELVSDADENQKGQYKIKRWYHKENEFDNVENLSKGEKNIIAFLYFLFSLEKIGDDNKPKIVVLDDPITSNDDTMQYLMIGEIQKFYKKLTDDNFFILLTHNCHFYLNVRKQNDKFYEKYGNFHLFSDGKLTSTRVIENGNDDFKTNYEMLWKELLFLHEKDKPDLMLNSCRKICETYIKFNCKTDFYGDNVNAKKLFDVNLHSIDDLEAEQNGKTRDEIKDILKSLFEQNKAEEHFNAYWK